MRRGRALRSKKEKAKQEGPKRKVDLNCRSTLVESRSRMAV